MDKLAGVPIETVRVDGGSHTQTTRIDMTDRTMSAIALAISTLAIGLCITALILGQISERESRLAQQDTMLLRATLVAHGISYNEDDLKKEPKK